MQFENSFSVEAPIDRVWRYLLDVEAVAPCVPGAQLTEIVSDNEFKGAVKVKLGAVQVTYKGTIVLQEVDEEARKVVLTASGSETRGTGSASGTITSTLSEDSPSRTTVHMVSEVNVTGKVAQFGRNIMQDVSNRLIRQFAECLEANLSTPVEETSSSTPPVTGEAAADHDAGPSGSEGPNPQEESPRQIGEESPTPGQPHRGAATASAELQMMPILVDAVRSRTASALRSIAKVLEPKK